MPYDSAFKCRVEQVLFTGQYAGEAIAIAYDEAKYPDGGPVPAYFRFDSVAVENDSIADFYLSSFPGGQLQRNIHRFATMEEAMAALNAGEGVAVHRQPLAGLGKSTWTLGLGSHFAYRPLSYWADDAVRYALEDGRIEAIFAEYGLLRARMRWRSRPGRLRRSILRLAGALS